MRSLSKVALLIVVLLLALTAARAQQPANPVSTNQESTSEVAVLKFKWNKFVERPGWDKPLSMQPVGNETQSSVRQTVTTNRPQPRAPTLGRPETMPRGSADLGVPGSQSGAASDSSLWGVKGFQYHVTVQNTGERVITGIVWDYAFTSRDARHTIEHHPFASLINIKPGKSKEITLFSTTPPTQTVSAAAPHDKLQPFTESVTIYRIEYADGHAWVRQMH